LPAVILLLLVLLLALLGVRRRQAAAQPPIVEYWVYLPTDKTPSTDEILKHLFATFALGPPEGLLFSDVRLHMAVLLRSKNAHLFVSDLLEEATPMSPEQLQLVANADALMKIRYVCDPPASDDRYLKLLPKIALATARLTGGGPIYDLPQRRVFDVSEMEALLPIRLDAARGEVHVRAFWVDGMQPRAETRGLRKKGLAELRTGAMEPDEQVLVTHLVEEAGREIWKQGELPEKVVLNYFETEFEVRLEKPKKPGPVMVHLLRRGVP
jgi:hypothetical protein